MQIHFILVNPATPGNIGSSARAIKTMGFTSFRLVDPYNPHSSEARKLAYGSSDVLESAQLFPTLGKALNDIDFAIATTSKKRTVLNDYFTPEESKKIIEEKGDSISSLGIVFGSEENGLLEEEIAMCDLRSSIPLAHPYPSVNLSQSVMIYAYIFSNLELSISEVSGKSPDPVEQKVLKNRAGEILRSIDVTRNPNLYRRMIERLMLANQDDTHLFLSFHRFLKRKLDKLA